MTLKRLLSAALFALLAAPAFAAPPAGATSIKDPVTVAVQVKATAAQLRKAVRAALLNRGWKLDHEKDGYLEAAVDHHDARRAYTARISLSYDLQQIVVRYVSSEGLQYDAAARTILPDYNGWMDMLAKDLPVYLSLATE